MRLTNPRPVEQEQTKLCSASSPTQEVKPTAIDILQGQELADYEEEIELYITYGGD